MAAETPRSQAVEEYVSWIDLDCHSAEGTVAECSHDLESGDGRLCRDLL